MVAVLHLRLSIPKMLIHWIITFFGNLAGSLFVVTLITGYGGILMLQHTNQKSTRLSSPNKSHLDGIKSFYISERIGLSVLLASSV